ncbi:response regulator [Kerstersia gyiorum]|uniref:response regulator n=1 Tax=Kerstersia gyiorum TaxID=206506 RepID=UPI00209FA4BF|nr:response regulator transcription factor [Kerstersia gyiorum]MCP1670206.1 DNA-binding NarL/FixJ family response regulator [Kerstersia gyiorum]MCP1708113.1 DNA-binding NarL/FixJ family response regulator [Kerstersia gyiorum]
MQPNLPPQAMLAPIRIMLVDDHELVRDGIRLCLSAHPELEIVGEAAGHDQALALLAQLSGQADGAGLPDLVLTDLNMRGPDGLALIAAIHERWPQIATLVLSMHDNTEYITRALRAGARGYLLKDGPSQELVQALGAVMNGQPYFSASVMAQLARSQPYGPEPLLTQREKQILALIGSGSSSKQIARELDLSVRTVESHRLNIRRKLQIDGQAELIKYAVKHKDRL